jgi:hypothetical protein
MFPTSFYGRRNKYADDRSTSASFLPDLGPNLQMMQEMHKPVVGWGRTVMQEEWFWFWLLWSFGQQV